MADPVVVRLTLNAPALRLLLAGDPTLELDLRDAAMKEILKHGTDHISETVQKAILTELSHAIDVESGRWEKEGKFRLSGAAKTYLDTAVRQYVVHLVSEHLHERLSEIREAVLLEIKRQTDRAIETMIENRVRDAVKAAVNVITRGS